MGWITWPCLSTCPFSGGVFQEPVRQGGGLQYIERHTRVILGRASICVNRLSGSLKKPRQIMSYEIIWEPRGAVKRFFGRVTSHDMLQSVVDTESDARFDDLRYVINDFLDIEELDLANIDIQEIAAIDGAAAKSNPRITIAVVTIHDEIVALTNQYAGSPFNAYPIKAFSTSAEARSWLGVT